MIRRWSPISPKRCLSPEILASTNCARSPRRLPPFVAGHPVDPARDRDRQLRHFTLSQRNVRPWPMVIYPRGHNLGKYRPDFHARLVQPAANFLIRQFQAFDRAIAPSSSTASLERSSCRTASSSSRLARKASAFARARPLLQAYRARRQAVATPPRGVPANLCCRGGVPSHGLRAPSSMNLSRHNFCLIPRPEIGLNATLKFCLPGQKRKI